MDHTFTSATLLLMLVTDPLGNIPIFSAALKDVARERKPMVIARECGFAFAFGGRPLRLCVLVRFRHGILARRPIALRDF